MQELCKDHESHVIRIQKLESAVAEQWEKLDAIAAKLNLILGGIIISPFVIALITLLINLPK